MYIATKILMQQDHDNKTLDRLIARDNYQDHIPFEVDQNWEKEETAYIYEDGSALINNNNDWRVVTNYGRHIDHEKY